MMSKKIKLDKTKLEESWSNGGRKANKWCNYYLVEKGNSKYLVEQSNLYAWLFVILLSPVLLPLLLLVVVVSFAHQALSWVADNTTFTIKPLSVVCMSAFTKDKVRSDWLKESEYKELLKLNSKGEQHE